MGISLKLLPFRYGDSDTVLSVEVSHELYDLLTVLPRRDVPEDFNSYVSRANDVVSVKYPEDDVVHYGLTIEDDYGNPVGYTKVKDLLTLRQHEDVLHLRNNRAVWAYLSELPEDEKVALYWS